MGHRSYGPVAPPGWEEARDQLVRIVAPGNNAIAWLAPDFGGNCVGYAVRQRREWIQLLHAAGPARLGDAPIRYGCPILFPFPGHVRDARYRWGGMTHVLPAHLRDRPHHAHGFAARHPWRVIQSGRNTVVAEFSTATDIPGGPQAVGYPFPIRLALRLVLSDDALSLALTATNEGPVTAPVGLGFHTHFALAALGSDRESVRVALPGALEHILAATIPTGAKRPVIDREIAPPPPGERLLVARTRLGERSLATVTGRPGTPTIRMLLDDGCHDILLFVPPEEPSIALEPHSCAPGAASQPEGHVDGLVGVEPGSTLRLAIRVSVAWA